MFSKRSKIASLAERIDATRMTVTIVEKLDLEQKWQVRLEGQVWSALPYYTNFALNLKAGDEAIVVGRYNGSTLFILPATRENAL
jgi:membrane protein implicated in regulation of membrane protease activity